MKTAVKLLLYSLASLTGMGLGVLLSKERYKRDEGDSPASSKEVSANAEDHFDGRKLKRDTGSKSKNHLEEQAGRTMKGLRWGYDLDQVKSRFDRAQVTIFNPTSSPQTVNLWGDQVPSAPSYVPDVLAPEDHVHVRALLWNPANQHTYIIGQLSNSVTILSAKGQKVSRIELEPNSLPGTHSPVDAVVNTDTSSPHYGYVYVVGSVSDTVTIIHTHHQIEKTIAVGKRPLSIRFNPLNHKIYVANLASDTVSVIDAQTHELETTLEARGKAPEFIEVCPKTGRVFIVNGGDLTVSIFDADHGFIRSLSNVIEQPISTCYCGVRDEILILNEVGKITAIDCLKYRISSFTLTGATNLLCHSEKLYASTTNKEIQVLDKDRKLERTLMLSAETPALTLNENTDTLIGYDPGLNRLNEQPLSDKGSALVFDADYRERVEEFKFNPAMVKHVKFSFSGEEMATVLTQVERSVSGKEIRKPLSLASYCSPQSFQNMYEVTGLNDSLIDGHRHWQFRIAPHQTVSVLLYYDQMERSEGLPIQSTKVTPII